MLTNLTKLYSDDLKFGDFYDMLDAKLKIVGVNHSSLD
jgi:hypothetical protein